MNIFRSRKFILLYILLILMGAILGLFYSVEREVRVKAEKVKVGYIEQIVEMSGYVDSVKTENITSNTDGIISNLSVEEGSKVRKGQILCTIRSPGLRRELLELRAELITTGGDIRTALTEAAKRLARARYNFIRANISDLEETIHPRAHIDGEVIRAEVQNGEQVIRGEELFYLADVSRPIVKAHMDESDTQKVKVGQPVWIKGDFLSGRSLQGKVSKISGFVSKEDGTFVETDCMVFNPDKMTLKFGAYADIRVTVARKKNVLQVPNEALIMDGVTQVFVVKNRRAYLIPVKIGIVGENYTEVVSGLKEGEWVVTMGSLDLNDGDKINLREPSGKRVK